ncbi:MAG: hypothetical protein ACXACG_12210 [Candidatus Thorarchaeota archaeon]
MTEEPRYPYSPARIMARAYHVGLSALKDLLRERVITNLRDVYDSTQNMWTEAQEKWEGSKRNGQRDFSHITRVEKHMRSNFLKMIWETTARYGNREFKRVQNERKGKIGPMNKLLNMAGAQMRNFAVTRFPIPMPDVVGRDGKRRVYGYVGDETYPLVQVTHATLPEMDFVDMIRSHVFELCRKCFVNNVPMREARRYVNLLIYRLAPFLEYLYTSGESGMWGFKRKRRTRSEGGKPDADSILREIVMEIDAFYGTHNGRPRSVTERLAREYEPLGVSLFLDESIRLRGSDEEEQEEWGVYLRELCNDHLLHDRDAQWLQAEAKRRARRYGIRLHNILSMGLPQPYSARSVILEGDKFVRVGEDLLIVAELSFKTNLGDGRADLVIFRRHLLEKVGEPNPIPVWKPIAVFDIKSKSAFDWWIEGEEKQSKRHGDITVPKMMLRHRGFRDDEWDLVKQHAPSNYERRQLEVYAGSLQYTYSKLTGDESIPLPVLGTILVDTAQDSGLVRRNLLRLVDSLFEEYCDDLTPHVGQKLVVSLDEQDTQHLRLSLVVYSVNSIQRMMLQDKGDSLDERAPASQFNKDGKMILYSSVPSGSRSGPTAAWIAKYWHGLVYIQSFAEGQRIDKVVWIDVSGDFRSKRLAWSGLRLDQHQSQIQQFFKDVEILDVSEHFQSFLFRGEKMPTLRSILDEVVSATNDSMIVVSGWEMLESMTPERVRSALRECKLHLIEDLVDRDGWTLWFEQPRNGEATSGVYQRKKVVPFYDRSPFCGKVRKVVWNLPSRPYASGQTTSMFDDLRVIVEQGSENRHSSFCEVSVLSEWSSRFWNQRELREDEAKTKRQRGRQVLTIRDVLNSGSLSSDLQNSALDLIQGLESGEMNDESKQHVSVLLVERMRIVRMNDLKILRTPILTFRPRTIGVRGGLGYVASSTTLPEITKNRGYRANIWRNSSIKRNYRPPSESCLVTDGASISHVCQLETDRVYRVLKMIRDIDSSSEWLSFIKGANDTLERCEKHGSVRLFAEFLRNHPVSGVLWEQLTWHKGRMLAKGLSEESAIELESLLTDNLNLCLDTGNYLFLLILALKHVRPSISSDDLTRIWSDLGSWQLLQLGFYIDSDHAEVAGRSTFDVSRIWSDIMKRVGVLSETPIPGIPKVRYGRVLVVEGEDGVHEFWMVLQKRFRSSETISGMWRNANPVDPSGRFRWSVNRSDVLATSARRAKSPLEFDDIAVIDSVGSSFLWIQDGDRWNPAGRIEIIQKVKGVNHWIRGVRVHPSSAKDVSAYPSPMSLPNEMSELLIANLDWIQDLAVSCLAVECSIGLDSENYVLTLHSSETDEIFRN